MHTHTCDPSQRATALGDLLLRSVEVLREKVLKCCMCAHALLMSLMVLWLLRSLKILWLHMALSSLEAS